MLIPGFSKYSLINNEIINTITNKVMHRSHRGNPSEFYQLYSDTGIRKKTSYKNVKALCNIDREIEVPKNALPIKHSNGEYFIDTLGNVYSFSNRSPAGKILIPQIGTNGYPIIKLHYKGKMRVVEIHQLLCVTFILEDYIERGLVCLHKDDCKTNCNLSNLSVGTYSQNNKDAYKTGLNPGNGLKKTNLP